MPVLSTNALTLVDHAKRLDPNGTTADIVELLAQTNEVLRDMVWLEGNLPTGHRTTVRTGLPQAYWRRLNEGVATSKSTTAQHDEMCGMLEAWSEVDKDLAELNGNTAEFRLSEAQAFIEAMSQEMASTLFYGNTGTAPQEFNGLATRYASRNAAFPSSQNVLHGGGTSTDNASVWLVVWGKNTLHGIFPKGSKAGLMHEDLGLDVIETTAGVGGARMMGYRDHWQWKCGVAVRDWRYAVRIANIDVSNLTTKSSAADLEELMIRAYHRIPNFGAGKAAIYMNRTCFQMLDIQRRDDVQTGGQLKYEQVEGVMRPVFRGIPIGKCDALLETEAAVTT